MNKNKQNKVSVITLGCSKNTVDSERLMKQLQVNKFDLAEDPNDAETLIINTCGFIEAAKNESIETILNAVALKKLGQVKKIVVAGCLSERYKGDLIKEIPEVDAFFGTEKRGCACVTFFCVKLHKKIIPLTSAVTALVALRAPLFQYKSVIPAFGTHVRIGK